ncbi:MAG TPA: glycoside hydrolase family 16 protein [Lacibacter sp.]|nr:glycoside hydrolase family 16 protein [Lacibacter sp.]HMO90118.1 glycoside hydrolase family 16 protein [Lacibacter sp.]
MRKGSKYSVLVTIVPLLLLMLMGCEKEAKQTLPKRSWELVWSDEFTGAANSLPDATKWAFDIGATGWGNQELQFYTNRPSNVSLDGNGNLVITARQESYFGAPFTSARVKTQGKFAQAYGRFEARIKTVTGPGLWPAFWMLGANIDTKPWPQCGEIDIMEQRGQEPYINNASIHGPGYSGGNAITKSFALTNGRFDTEFHLYAVEWGTDFIDFFIDDFLYKRVTPKDVPGEWVYNQPFFIIMNVAVGGNYVGFPTTGTPFPQTMLIDYVRVYKQL